MDELVGQQLVAIAEVLEVADRLGAAVWLRGGWAVDFFLGEVTREHLDVDWFAWREDLPGLIDALAPYGWSDLAVHPIEQQRDLARDGVELGFAPLARADDSTVVVGGGPWSGTPWPVGMIEQAVLGQCGGLHCPVISPAAQVEIKRMMPIWVPGRPCREKDSSDIARLVRALPH